MAAPQATEVGPVRGKDGPCLLLLKGIRSTAADFLEWFESAEWLRRCVTRVYFFPVEEPKHCAPSLAELLRKVVDATKPPERATTLRLQCLPRTNEMPVIVRPGALPRSVSWSHWRTTHALPSACSQTCLHGGPSAHPASYVAAHRALTAAEVAQHCRESASTTVQSNAIPHKHRCRRATLLYLAHT